MPYRSLLGALQYAAETRPDIKGAVSVLSRFQENPGMTHWKALKRVLAYLVTTKKRELVLGRDANEPDEGEWLRFKVDADHGGCLDTRRSTTGLIMEVMGSVIMTLSKRQSCVASSTLKAEMMAIRTACHQIENMKLLLGELGIEIDTVPIYSDSRNALESLAGDYPSKKAKHFCLLWYEIKEYLTEGVIQLHFVEGEENTADVLTKPLVKVKHEKHTANLLKDQHWTGGKG